MKKSVPHTQQPENHALKNCNLDCKKLEDFNEIDSQSNCDSTENFQEIDFNFDSPRGNKTNGKMKAINSFKSRYNQTDAFSENEQIERQRTADENDIELEFIDYYTEREYQKPERIGPDGNKRRYLIDRTEKKNEFDNIRYNELKKT